jgi:hypothetical protein
MLLSSALLHQVRSCARPVQRAAGKWVQLGEHTV